MPSDPADNEQQQDEVPTEDAAEQGQKFGRDAEDERDRAAGQDDVIEAPEGEYPPGAKGFDGSTVDEILEEREKRLDPENRPENSEVSNAGREIDLEKGMFTDDPDYEDAEPKFDPHAGA